MGRELILNVGFMVDGVDLNLHEKSTITIDPSGSTIISSGWSTSGVKLENVIALPPLFNAHIHVGDYAFPEIGIELSLPELVAEPHGLKHRMLKSTPRDRLVESIRRLFDYLVSIGVLGVADFREGGVDGLLVGLEASKNKPLNYFPLARPTSISREELLTLKEKAYGLGLSTPIRYKVDELRLMASLFSDKVKGAHVAEVPDNALKEFTLALEELKADYIVHGTYLGLRELEQLAERGIGLILCPRANSWFGVGVPRVDLVVKLDVLAALGTDNAGWVKPDLWRELEYTWNLIRLKGLRDIDPRKILAMATINPLRIFKVEAEYLVDGGEASFILIDGYSSNIVYAHNKIAGIVKRGGGEHVLAVFFKGKCVYGSLCSRIQG